MENDKVAPVTLEELARENLRLTKEVHAMSRRVDRYVTIQHILSAIYFVMIVGPIILGVIFLPPLLSGLVGQYQDLLAPAQPSVLDGILNSLQSGDQRRTFDEMNKIIQQGQISK